MTEQINMSITLPVETATQLDLLAASIQQSAGPVGRVTRSAVVREILQRHRADGAPAAPITPAPICQRIWTRNRTRVRRRKPEGE